MEANAAKAVCVAPEASRAKLADFRSLFERVRKAADGAALIWIRRDDREDVAQLVCIAAWRRWCADPEYFARRDVVAWAVVAALNVYRNMRKAERARRGFEAAFVTTYEEYQRPWMDPTLGLNHSALVYAAREALARLSPRCRSAFVAVRFHGLSYKEAGEHLGLAMQTVAGYVMQGQIWVATALSEWRNDNA